MFAMPVLSLLLATTTQDMSARIKADAQDARQQLAVVFVKVGQGAKQVGTGVKKRAKKVGQGVKEAFTPQP